jgi:hypothetical protein
MSVPDLMQALEHMPFAVAIAKSTWLFPFLETLHVLALTLVVGSVAVMDMRLLGLGSMDRTVTEVTRSVLPWTWSAFAGAAVCGGLLFSSKASTYYVNVPFRMKMGCLGLAAANMFVYHLLSARGVASWNHGVPPLRVRVTGAISLALWIMIVATGRWIGFTT